MGVRTRGQSPLAGRSKAYLVFFAIVAILSVTGAAMAASPQQGSGGTVIAEFQNVGPITNQAVVRIGGTDVGTTGAPEVDAERRIATMPLNLDAKAFPLYKNAHARIDQLSLIGEKYVELTPGTPDAGVMGPGDRITVQQTELAPDYQNLIQVLNDPTAAGLASLVRELGTGVQGRGQNVQDILYRWEPAFGQLSGLLNAINRQNGALGRIVDQVQPLANGLAADQGRTLDGTLNSANSLLNTTTVNEQNLRATLAELPTTLAAARRTLGTLTGTAQEGETTLRELRPTSDNLAAISRELRGFTDAANPALKALNPLLDDANRLLDEARPLAAELKRTGGPLNDVFRNLRPVSTSVTNNLGGPYGTGPDPQCFLSPPSPTDERFTPEALEKACLNPRIQGILGFVHNFALAVNNNDTVSHYGRLFTIIDATSTMSADTGPKKKDATAASSNTGSTNPLEGTENTYLPCAFRGPGSERFCVNGQRRGPQPGGFAPGEPPSAGSGGKDKGKDAEKTKASMDALGKVLPGMNQTILRGDANAGGSATGLTPTQEQDALGTLMGGR